MKNIDKFDSFLNEGDRPRGEMPIDALIMDLERLKKKGCTKVQIDGTVMCKEDGNTIIFSTEKQM